MIPVLAARLRNLARSFRRELDVYRIVLQDPRTPPRARWLLGLAIGYAVFPIDILPDFIPGIGQIDDALIVPTLVKMALRSIPREVVDDARARVAEEQS